MFFHLYGKPITPLGIPSMIVPRVRVGGIGRVIMGKDKLALKCFSGKINLEMKSAEACQLVLEKGFSHCRKLGKEHEEHS